MFHDFHFSMWIQTTRVMITLIEWLPGNTTMCFNTVGFSGHYPKPSHMVFKGWQKLWVGWYVSCKIHSLLYLAMNRRTKWLPEQEIHFGLLHKAGESCIMHWLLGKQLCVQAAWQHEQKTKDSIAIVFNYILYVCTYVYVHIRTCVLSVSRSALVVKCITSWNITLFHLKSHYYGNHLLPCCKGLL